MILAGFLISTYWEKKENEVTVKVTAVSGNSEFLLPGEGKISLIHGYDSLSMKPNAFGVAVFQAVPDKFFEDDSITKIQYRDRGRAELMEVHQDSLYSLEREVEIQLLLKEYWPEKIVGETRDDKGNPLAEVGVVIRGDTGYSNKKGEFSILLPESKRQKYQDVKAFKPGYEPVVLKEVPAVEGGSVNIMMQ